MCKIKTEFILNFFQQSPKLFTNIQNLIHPNIFPMNKSDNVTYVNPKASHPGKVMVEDHEQNNWKFIFKKSAISPSKDID